MTSGGRVLVVVELEGDIEVEVMGGNYNGDNGCDNGCGDSEVKVGM